MLATVMSNYNAQNVICLVTMRRNTRHHDWEYRRNVLSALRGFPREYGLLGMPHHLAF